MEDNTMDKNQKRNKENGEDATKYGEFVSSYFGWITSKQQKNRADELEKMTQKGEQDR